MEYILHVQGPGSETTRVRILRGPRLVSGAFLWSGHGVDWMITRPLAPEVSIPTTPTGPPASRRCSPAAASSPLMPIHGGPRRLVSTGWRSRRRRAICRSGRSSRATSSKYVDTEGGAVDRGSRGGGGWSREHRRRITTPTPTALLLTVAARKSQLPTGAHAQAQAGPASSSMAAQRCTRSAGRFRTLELDMEDSCFHFHGSQRVLSCCTARLYILSTFSYNFSAKQTIISNIILLTLCIIMNHLLILML